MWLVRSVIFVQSNMKPQISYREKDKGGRALNTGVINPETALTSVGPLILLIHGYNNNRIEAEKSYEQFFRRQREVAGEVHANVVSVYWPGDNWEGPVFYMQALGQVAKVAPALAADLCKAAEQRGILRLSIIAHSLGCRLTLETLAEIKRLNKTGQIPIHVDRVIFMAGAVPVCYLEADDDGRLLPALESVQKAGNLFSRKDSVLHYAFPLGQTLGEGLLFPVALGRKYWSGGVSLPSMSQQQENDGAGHSDYWGGDSGKINQLKQAAAFIRGFIPGLGTPPPRAINSRTTAEPQANVPRSTQTSRTVATRSIA
jgi:pimeloyl-ACP methyl ester carboxylesterase